MEVIDGMMHVRNPVEALTALGVLSTIASRTEFTCSVFMGDRGIALVAKLLCFALALFIV